MAIDESALKELEKIRQQMEELKKQQELIQQQVIQGFKEFIRPKVQELVEIAQQIKIQDKNVKNYMYLLEEARKEYTKQTLNFQEKYEQLKKDVKDTSPELLSKLDDVIYEIAPELKGMISEQTQVVAKQVTRALQGAPRFIDPLTGQTYKTWTDALKDRGQEDQIRKDSPARVFVRLNSYELLPITDITFKAVNDCVETPGCLENLKETFLNRVRANPRYILQENDALDIILDYLKNHKTENV